MNSWGFVFKSYRFITRTLWKECCPTGFLVLVLYGYFVLKRLTHFYSKSFLALSNQPTKLIDVGGLCFCFFEFVTHAKADKHPLLMLQLFVETLNSSRSPLRLIGRLVCSFLDGCCLHTTQKTFQICLNVVFATKIFELNLCLLPLINCKPVSDQRYNRFNPNALF